MCLAEFGKWRAFQVAFTRENCSTALGSCGCLHFDCFWQVRFGVISLFFQLKLGAPFVFFHLALLFYGWYALNVNIGWVHLAILDNLENPIENMRPGEITQDQRRSK